jgi:hypothetical protein
MVSTLIEKTDIKLAHSAQRLNQYHNPALRRINRYFPQ